MKESELILKMKAIQDKLDKSEIVQKCYQVARDHGKGKTVELSYRTTQDYTLERENLKIHIDDGWGIGAGGEIKVNYNREQVLYGDRYALDKPENKFNPKVDGFCILKYIEGKKTWEKEINEILNPTKPEKVQESLKDPIVETPILKRLEDSFSDF